MITFLCICGQRLQLDDGFAGRRVFCPTCQHESTAPGTQAIAPVDSVPAAATPGSGAFAERPVLSRGHEEYAGAASVPLRPADSGERMPGERRHEQSPGDRGPGAGWDDPGPRRQRPARTSGLAVASLISGCVTFLVPILPAIPAIILGILGLREVKRGAGAVTGAGLAITGIITGLVGNVSLILYVMFFGAIGSAQARQITQNNLKQIGLAMHGYHGSYNRLPSPAFGTLPGQDPFGQGPFAAKGPAHLSWRVAILPYIEHDALFKQFRLNEPWDSPHNILLLPHMPKVYEPVGAKTAPTGHTFFQVCTGPNTMFPDPFSKPRLVQIHDGTSNTFLVLESGTPVPWTKPADYTPGMAGPLPPLGAQDASGFHVVFADGSARFFNHLANSEQTIRLAIDPVDGMALDLR